MADARRPRPKKAAPRSAAELRRQAEEHLDGLSAVASSMPEEITAAVHELRVHQIELEMQNEELRRAHLEVEEQRAKYFDLFDLAPVGYLTISDKGLVRDANFTAARLLSAERQLLVGQPFSAFVFAADRRAYYRHLELLQQTEVPQSCELRLQPIGAEPFWALLESRPQGAAGDDPSRYRVTFTDVQESVLAEEALKLSREQYRALVENVNDVIFTLDLQGTFTFVSPAIERLFGYTSAEVEGVPFSRFIHPDDLGELAESFAQTVAGIRAAHEFRVLDKAGTAHWVVTRSRLVAEDGSPPAITGVMSDITARKQGEMALQESEKRFRALVEWTPEAVVVHRGKTLIYVNPAAVTMFGASSAEELVGKPILDLVHPDCHRVVLERVKKGLDHDVGAPPIELRYVKLDGTIFEAEVQGTAIVYDGEPAIHVALRDVSARKQAEEALRESEQNFRAFFETVDDIIVVSTPEGRIVYANPAASAKLGYSAAELAGMHVLDLHPPEKRGEAETISAALLSGEGESCPLPLQSKSGVLLPVETRVWFGRWDGEECTFGVSKDLTKEQEALQKFAQVFHGNPGLMAVTSLPEGRFTEVNEAFLGALGYSREEVLGHTDEELGLFVDARQQREIAELLLAQGRVADRELKIRCKDGAILDVLLSGEIIESQGHEYFLTVMSDETERKRAREALRETTALLSGLLTSIPDIVFFKDCQGVYLGCNAEFARYTGRDAAGIVGATDHELFGKEIADFYREQDGVMMARGEPRRNEEWIEYPDGARILMDTLKAPLRDGDGQVIGLLGVSRDVTVRRRAEEALADLNDELVAEAAALEEANATITRIAATDHLTGLANRRHFYEALEKAVSLARRHGSPLALVSFDLDGLKRVNDSAGHEAGDEVLTSFAELLGALCRAEDLPARLGGDEFSVLLPGMELGGARGLAERLLAAVRSCAALAQRRVTVSGGVTQWTPPGELPDELLRRADEALYAAKREGGDAVAGDG